MLSRDADNVVVIEGAGGAKPIGIARAADILRLRRWVLEEEGHKSGQPAGA
jgi:chloride channel protein, CIC family